MGVSVSERGDRDRDGLGECCVVVVLGCDGERRMCLLCLGFLEGGCVLENGC